MMALCLEPTYCYYITWTTGKYPTTARQLSQYANASYNMTKDYTTKLNAT